MKAVWVTNTRSSEYVVVDGDGKPVPNVIVVVPDVDEDSVRVLRVLGFNREADVREEEIQDRKEDKAWT